MEINFTSENMTLHIINYLLLSMDPRVSPFPYTFKTGKLSFIQINNKRLMSAAIILKSIMLTSKTRGLGTVML